MIFEKDRKKAPGGRRRDAPSRSADRLPAGEFEDDVITEEITEETKTPAAGESGKPLSREQEALREWFRTVRFRKALVGGVDEVRLWKKLEELEKLYEEALLAERARYDVLLRAYGKSAEHKIRRLRRALQENGQTEQPAQQNGEPSPEAAERKEEPS